MFQEVMHKHLAVVVEECDALMYTSLHDPKPSFKFRHLWSKPRGWLRLSLFPPLSGLWQSCHPTGQGQGALALGWEMRYTSVVGHVGRLGLNISDNMMKAANPVVGDGLENIEELFLLQGEEVIIVRLADDGWLSVESILKELHNKNICW
jgi:hypothetical protein